MDPKSESLHGEPLFSERLNHKHLTVKLYALSPTPETVEPEARKVALAAPKPYILHPNPQTLHTKPETLSLFAVEWLRADHDETNVVLTLRTPGVL